jgi:hypothetical protein
VAGHARVHAALKTQSTAQLAAASADKRNQGVMAGGEEEITQTYMQMTQPERALPGCN